MTNIKHSCYNHYQLNAIMLKSYEVTLSPENKLCNSVSVLTDVIRTVISGIQVLIFGLLKR
ncbi:hypothetical protein B6J05_04845 [Klebsiella quasipneumoniae]|nr:hypothetical protein [Klebsiella quasipneumoniae]MBZ7053121.1 hypothetical protein [Klebsiella quasipneumoniae]PLG19163.1 hypothetical protein B6J05_04845 [Klebsiella quasipneumoniae]RNT37792.1 hypothetical protein B9473_026335 [Klebsiella quasipneumoniae subsp. quasipneumoniae]HBY1471838.1 hypothetical protein [Klebsiella quasipneumoniae]